MADALSKLEDLQSAYKYLAGAKAALADIKKVHSISKTAPRDVDEVKKILKVGTKKYAPLKTYLSGVQDKTIAAAAAKFPPIPDPIFEARKQMEKVAKASGPNSPGFEKALSQYIKALKTYDHDLRERLTYMALVKDKCDLNIKDFTKMDHLIRATIRALEQMFITFPEAHSTAGGELLEIAIASFQEQPASIVRAFKRLKVNATAHEKEIKRQHLNAKVAMKRALDRKLKLVMEDAKTFMNKLFA